MLLDLTLEDTYGTHGANVVQFSRLSRRHAAADSRQPGSVFCLVAGAAGRCSLSPVAPPALQFPSSVLSARMDMAAVHLQPGAGWDRENAVRAPFPLVSLRISRESPLGQLGHFSLRGLGPRNCGRRCVDLPRGERAPLCA